MLGMPRVIARLRPGAADASGESRESAALQILTTDADIVAAATL